MKIDFYIAGIQKSGTTNLAYLLNKCSNIITHPQMECTFFYNEHEYQKGFDYLQKEYFFNYHETSNGVPHYTLIKHSGTFTNPDVFLRVMNHSPDVKFLLIFRNPIQRFVSSYLMEQTRSLYPYDLKTAIQKSISDTSSIEHKIFYTYGQYDVWLKNILHQVPQKNIHLFLFEELYDDTEHHIEQFAKHYDLNLNLNNLKEISNQGTIQNSHKEYRSYWYQKIVVKLRHSSLKKSVKKLIPTPYWTKLIRKIEHLNLIEPQEKYTIEDELKTLLKEHYYTSIKNFEEITGLKTNWLNE